MFAVVQTGSIASIAYVFAEYSQYFFKLPGFSEATEKYFEIFIPCIGYIYPLQNIGVKLLAIVVITLLSVVNYFGVVFGGGVAIFFTSMKILAILILAVLGFTLGNGSFSNFTAHSVAPGHSDIHVILAIAAALSGAFWAYDGWNNITYISGEVKNPQKNIPLALFWGTLTVMGVYILINLVYLYILPVDVMSQSKLVAADTAKAFLGNFGGAFIVLAVMLSTFGTANGSIMTSARVYFAMAKKKAFFPSLGTIHPKFHTPAVSLIVQCVWANILILSGSFDTITDMLIFVSWIFYGLGAFGVFVLRKKMPDAHRPYRVPGYPVIPAIFVLFSVFFVFITLYNDINNYVINNFAPGEPRIIKSLFGLLFVAIGIPLFVYFRRREKVI